MQERIEKINSIISDGIFIYGAGQMGKLCLDYLERENIKVLGFADNSQTVRDTINSEGKYPCYSYEKYLKKFNKYPILITPKFYINEIFSQYGKENMLMVSFYAWFENRCRSKYELLKFNDSKSYDTVNAILNCMRNSDCSPLYNVCEQNQYFCMPGFYNCSNEIFVDIEACTGDAVEGFLFNYMGSVKKIYAFEPGERQFKALTNRAKRLYDEWGLSNEQLELVNVCVGANDASVSFHEDGGITNMHISENGKTVVKQICFDSYFKDNKVTFIKADVEGAEFDVLCGAEKLIKRCRPKLAICVYHKPDDLIRIYDLVNSWNLGYKFALRQHSVDLGETVLYCWISN